MALTPETVVYVTRDIERALGTDPQEGYYIVTNQSDYAERIKRQFPHHVLLIESLTGKPLETLDLLKHPLTIDFLALHEDAAGRPPHLLVFKNSATIEPLAREQGWKLLNPLAATAERIENKITQIEWLGDLEKHLPPHRIELMKDVQWAGEPFIIQWAHGHTGEGTVLVRSEADIAALRHKFPERKARVTSFIYGPSFTVNAVACADKTLQGNVNYQITGIDPFTSNAFSTVGNDWKLARALLSAADIRSIASIVQEVGARMRQGSWRGLFGLDFIKDTANNRIFLIEINARQPASTTYESQLQRARRAAGAKGLTTFEAHLSALFGQSVPQPIIEIVDGAQIVQRVTAAMQEVSEDILGSLELAGYTALSYPNTEMNTDLLRIQSAQGIMADHGSLNAVGREIKDTLTYSDQPVS